jgi:diguanylate cyclase (GGDEF)-like protein
MALAAIAVLAVALALGAHERGLRNDLESAAAMRLDASARAADRLLVEGLRELVRRHDAVSRTPEFRAHLEIDHGPTLERFARELAGRTHAAAVVFLGRDNRAVAGFGDAALRKHLRLAWTSNPGDGDTAWCVALNAKAEGAGATAGFVPCPDLAGEARATVLAAADVPWLSAAIPLRTGGRKLGQLLVSERLDEAALAGWSDLAGARLELVAPGAATEEGLVRRVRGFQGTELRVASNLDLERSALARARWSLLGAGGLAVALAGLVSVVLARSLTRPIREIQVAAEQVGDGDFGVRLRSRRSDELGDVASAFDATLERLQQSQERLHRVQAIARFGDWTLDFATGAVDGSAEFRRLLGIAKGQEPLALEALLGAVDVRDRPALGAALDACRDRDAPLGLEVRLTGGGRDERVVELQGRPVRSGAVRRLEASMHDVTERRRSEKQIRFLAYRDSLTGLGNRRFLTERLELAAARPDSPPFALLFLDLDDFKLVNDTLGHAVGDDLLREVAARLWSVLPDPEAGAVARLGGDEFTLLVPDSGEASAIRRVAEAVLESVRRPYALAGQEVVVTASLGGAAWPEHCAGAGAEDLLRACDTALHAAKAEGRGGFRLYDASLKVAAVRRWQLEHRLRAAIDADELRLHYQPRVDSRTSRIVGFEALLRWNDPTLGPVAPSDFVALAEDTGLIGPLGGWVLDAAVSQLRAWHEAKLPVCKLSVNLSGRQLRHEIVDRIDAALASSGLDPRLLEFEVTESAVMDDEEVGRSVLRALRTMGVTTSLDDFGTGHSSLSVLRTLPLDAVKIDRSFVRDIASDTRDAELAAAIVYMAKVLGLAVVAEGVETEAQRELLQEMGCDELQGFLFGEAVPAERVPELLKEQPRAKRKRT